MLACPHFADRVLFQFLKARKWDVAKGVEMMVNSLAIRKKYKADSILDDYKPPVKMHFVYFPGSAKRGTEQRPLC